MSFITANYVLAIRCIALFCIPLLAMKNVDGSNDIARTAVTNRSISELKFPSTYHVYGTIRIPSASITEPFQAWYAGKYNRSRIDYYEGTVKTFQRGDIGKYGTLYEIVPKYDYRHKSHYQGCWKKSGKKNKKIEAQNVLPKNVYWPFRMNLAQFKFQGTKILNGAGCTKWMAAVEAYGKNDTYIFYATDELNPRPVRFEMQGYDILLTSYYDHYIVDYNNFTAWKYDSEIFDIPQVARRDQWCRKLPKNIGEAGYHNINPMEELLDREGYEEFKTKFKCFQDKFGKNYEHEEEHRKRMHIARHNMRYIHSMNRKQLGFELDINHFTDLTEEEFKNHRGTLYDDDRVGTNEYEKRVPTFDENFELQEEDVEKEAEEKGNRVPMFDGNFELKEERVEKQTEKKGNRKNTHMSSDNNEQSLSMEDSSLNTAEIDRKGRKDGKGIYEQESRSHKITENPNMIDRNENIHKIFQRATDFNYASKPKVIESAARNDKKSEIARKSFETEMKELEILGEQLDELSQQLSRKNSTNATLVKESKVGREYNSEKVIAKYNERVSFKNETYPIGNFSKWDENYINISKNLKGKTIKSNTTSNRLTNAYKKNGSPIAGDVAFTKKSKFETENGIKRQHLESSYNGDQPSKKLLSTRADGKRAKPHATIHKVKTRIKMSKEGESLFDNTGNYQPIAEEEIFASIDNGMLTQMNEDSIDDFYTPKVQIRKIKDNYIDITFPSEEESNNEKNSVARRRSFQNIYADYDAFEKKWRKPAADVHPFFMLGVDHRQLGVNQAETLEYDFTMNDNNRFPENFQLRRGKGKHKKKHVLQQKTKQRRRRKAKIPVELDWRDYGALSPVQSQGICGSCWTFSTTAAVESAHFIKTGKLAKLSEQQLLDCTWYVPHSKEGNHGCMGGWTWKSFAYIKKFGLATSKSYGKYLGMESSCKASNYSVGATIDSFMKVASNSAKALMKAIAMYGPATASINTEAKTLKFYRNGIYNDKLCNGATDHSVLVVGYGREDGKLYWIVRNSWGTKWGSKGYIKIENGKCGLLKKPWVIINRKKRQLPWKNKINMNNLIEI